MFSRSIRRAGALSAVALAAALGTVSAADKADPKKAPAAAPQAQAPASQPAGDPVVARVDGQDIHRSDVIGVLSSLSPQQQQQGSIEQLVPLAEDELIASKLLLDEAQKAKLESDPEVQAQTKRAEQRIMENVWLSRTVKAKITDDMLHKKYDELVKANPPEDEVHARHILVKTEDEAKDVIKQLDKGADFAKLAKEKSTEPGAGDSGGDLGYITKDKVVPEFGDAAFKLDKGQYTKTPVHTQFGWHVIQSLDKRKQTPPTFDQVKPQLQNVVAQDLVRQEIDQLKSKAKIERFNLDGSPIQAAAATPPAGQAPAAAPAAPAAPAPAKK